MAETSLDSAVIARQVSESLRENPHNSESPENSEFKEPGIARVSDDLPNQENKEQIRDGRLSNYEEKNSEGMVNKSVEKLNDEEIKEKLKAEFLAALLQPCYEGADADYVGMRRLLLFRKFISGLDQRQTWTCNGKGYVAYCNYIRRLKNGGNTLITSQSSTPGDSGHWASSSSPLSIWNTVNDMHSLSFNNHKGRSFSSRRSFSSTDGESELLQSFKEPAYSFVGMHCIFDQCKTTVSVVKFGHLSSDILAYGAADGSLVICNVMDPPSVIHILKGHSKNVTDFDFSSNNKYISSSSLDKSVRVWDIDKGSCIRIVYGTTPQLCIRFHPVNNNFLLVGNANKEISVINFSTGRVIKKLRLENVVTAMDTDHSGQFVFVGDSQGCVHSLRVSSQTGELSRVHRNTNVVKKDSVVTSVQFRTFSLLQHGPVLLTTTKDGTISFFSVSLEVGGYLSLRCSLKLSPRVRNIKASFCPLLSLEKGEFIVSGSEDSNVYFYDLTRPKQPCVNKLQGHSSPVIGVAWNHGENLLASSDCNGVVIVWKRAKFEGNRP